MGKELRVYDSTGQHAPTAESRKMVQRMIACGMLPEDIAYMIGTTPAEVDFHYKQEIDNGTRMVTAVVADALLKNAVEKGDTIAQQFWLKNRANWVPQTKVDVNVNANIEITERQKTVNRVVDLMKTAIDPRKNDLKVG